MDRECQVLTLIPTWLWPLFFVAVIGVLKQNNLSLPVLVILLAKSLVIED